MIAFHDFFPNNNYVFSYIIGTVNLRPVTLDTTSTTAEIVTSDIVTSNDPIIAEEDLLHLVSQGNYKLELLQFMKQNEQAFFNFPVFCQVK